MIDYRIGDTRDVIATIPDNSVHLVACSPPFVALRSYLPADHPDKHREIGSEPDPATFIDTLLALTAEWGRVLAPWGSIAIELGDTYSSGDAPARVWPGLGDGKHDDNAGTKHLEPIPVSARFGDWPRAKCLALVPQAYAMSLAYGRNVLNGNDSPAGQWLVRNMIVWHRPNPAVGALGDKFRPSTSYITVATRSDKRWFDLTAVRVAPRSGDPGEVLAASRNVTGFRGVTDGGVSHPHLVSNPAGAPPLDAWFDQHDTWTLTTQPSRLAHYAMWPAKLAERLVLSMCPREVCGTCGEPRKRIERVDGLRGVDILAVASGNERGTGLQGPRPPMPTITRETLGWTDCGHENYAPGVVLDPFAGTGTTLCVADLHGRDGIGIDIDPRNRDLLEPRMAEVRKNLFGVKPELPGQIDLFGESA